MRRLITVLPVVLCCALAACGDSTAPPPLLPQVFVHLTRAGEAVLGLNDTIPSIECTVQLRAVGTGGRDRHADWDKALVYFAAGRDRITALDTLEIPASEVKAAWESGTINGESDLESRWYFRYFAPFHAVIEFHFTGLDGRVKKDQSASVDFGCGPEAHDSLPAARLEEAAFISAPPIQPGEQLRARFTASAAAGLWLTGVELSGPCKMTKYFFERFEQTANHEVVFQLPINCALGVPIKIDAFAFDYMLEGSGRSIDNGLALVDIVRPQLNVFLPSYLAAPGVRGEYFTDDTLTVRFRATDNLGVRFIHWTTPGGAGFRDSMAVGGRSVDQSKLIPVKTEWIGQDQFKFWARDGGGGLSDTTRAEPGALVFRAAVRRPVRRTVIPGSTFRFLVDEKRQRIYLLQGVRYRLISLSLATLQQVDMRELSVVPRGMDFTASGDSLLVAPGYLNTLVIFNLLNSTLVPEVIPFGTLRSGETPGWITVSADNRAFVTTEPNYQMMEVNFADGTQWRRPDAGLPIGYQRVTMGASRDREVLILNGYPNGLRRYEAATNTFGPAQPSPAATLVPSVDATGQLTAISLEVLDSNLDSLRTVHAITPGVYPSALTPDGQYLYYAIGTNLYRNRVSDGALLDRQRMVDGVGQMEVSQDGTKLYLMTGENYGDYTAISVIDLN